MTVMIRANRWRRILLRGGPVTNGVEDVAARALVQAAEVVMLARVLLDLRHQLLFRAAADFPVAALAAHVGAAERQFAIVARSRCGMNVAAAFSARLKGRGIIFRQVRAGGEFPSAGADGFTCPPTVLGFSGPLPELLGRALDVSGSLAIATSARLEANLRAGDGMGEEPRPAEFPGRWHPEQELGRALGTGDFSGLPR